MSDFVPYLVNAFVDWCCDNNNKTFVVLLAEEDDPQFKGLENHIVDGALVLNISPVAVKYFTINDDGISFECRIDGRVRHFSLALHRILCLQCFDPRLNRVLYSLPLSIKPGQRYDPDPDPPKPKKNKGHLKVVK